MSIDVEPLIFTVRWYDESWGYERVLPYKAVATLTIINKDTVFITGMHGTMNRKMMRELAAWLHLKHVKWVGSFRHGKWKNYSVEKYMYKAQVAE